jgi:C-terminal processing protease CtpA/Prc
MTLAVAVHKANKSSFPVVTNIESQSPAEDFGLEKNDEIIEINGNETNKKSDSKVASYIKNSGSILKLLVRRKRVAKVNSSKPIVSFDETGQLYDIAVESQSKEEIEDDISENIDEEEIAIYDESDEDKTTTTTKTTQFQVKLSQVILNSSKIHPNLTNEPSLRFDADAPVPRLCILRAYESNLGFLVLGSKTKLGVFKVGDIVPNSSAYYSGLRNGDFIIEINGKNVQSMIYEDLISLIRSKKEEDNLQMLVADKNTLEWYKDRETTISRSMVPNYVESLLHEKIYSDNETNKTSRSSSTEPN